MCCALCDCDEDCYNACFHSKLLDTGKAYYVHLDGWSAIFADAEQVPCTRAPPRQYEIDRHANSPKDYVVWTSLYGTTVNMNRNGCVSSFP